MIITVTELKSNLEKYLQLAKKEEIFITHNGIIISKLTNPYQDRIDIAKSLFGVLSTDLTLDETKKERLNSI